MDLVTFVNLTNLKNESLVNKAQLLCFYLYKETGENSFTNKKIIDIFNEAGFNLPNPTILRQKLKDIGVVKVQSIKSKQLEFNSIGLDAIHKKIGNLWTSEIVASNGEYIDEYKFHTNKKYITRIVKEINNTFNNNAFNATGVLIRRLLHICLVLTFEHLNLQSTILDPTSGNYVNLDKIINEAFKSSILTQNSFKKKIEKIQMIGNFAAHKIYYLVSKSDLIDIQFDLRTVLEELFHKGNI